MARNNPSGRKWLASRLRQNKSLSIDLYQADLWFQKLGAANLFALLHLILFHVEQRLCGRLGVEFKVQRDWAELSKIYGQ